MKIVNKINIDVSKENNIKDLIAKQNDIDSRSLTVTIEDNGKKLTVDRNATVIINARRADGSFGSFAGSVCKNGTASVPLTPWMLEISGKLICDISVINTDSSRLTTTSFSIDVEEASNPGCEISDNEKYDILVNLIGSCSQAVENCNAAAEKAHKASESVLKDVNGGKFNGASAYEIAVKNGYNGSESSWLRSLKGDTGASVKPEFANDISECTDTNKLYVLPDGNIYAYIKTATYPPIVVSINDDGWYYTGQNCEFHINDGSGGCIKETDLIPVTPGDKLKYTGRGFDSCPSVIWYDKDGILLSYEQYKENEHDYTTVVITVPENAVSARFISFTWGASAQNEPLAVTWVLCQDAFSCKWDDTGHAFVPTDYESRIIALENSTKKTQSVLLNKTVVYEGDSICASSQENGGGYAQIIANITGCVAINKAVGGGRLTSASADTEHSYHSVVDSLDQLPAEADIYCFEGGINDYWHNATLGEFSPFDYDTEPDPATVCGALETIFKYSINKFIGKGICFIIVHNIADTSYRQNQKGNTFADYREKMIGICEKYSIPYFDAFGKSGLCGWNDGHCAKYLNGTGIPDGCHPNAEAYKRYYAPQLISLFEEITPT